MSKYAHYVQWWTWAKTLECFFSFSFYSYLLSKIDNENDEQIIYEYKQFLYAVAFG